MSQTSTHFDDSETSSSNLGSDTTSDSSSTSSDVSGYFSDDDIIHKINNLTNDKQMKDYCSDSELTIMETN